MTMGIIQGLWRRRRRLRGERGGGEEGGEGRCCRVLRAWRGLYLPEPVDAEPSGGGSIAAFGLAFWRCCAGVWYVI